MDHGKKDADGICQDALLKAFARDVMIDMWYMTKDEGEHDKSWWIWYDLAVFDHMVVWAEKRPHNAVARSFDLRHQWRVAPAAFLIFELQDG